MGFVRFVALRYLTGRRGGAGFLTFAKALAIGGVAVGTAGLLIALAVSHGFKDSIRGKVLSYGPHLSVTGMLETPIYRADTLVTWLKALPEVDEAQAVLYGQVMLQHGDRVEGTFLKGVPAETGDLTGIRSYVSAGRYSVLPDSLGRPTVVLGAALARKLGVEPGDLVTAFAITGLPSADNLPQVRRFVVAGLYRTGVDPLDDVFVLMADTEAGGLLNLDAPASHQVDVRLRDLALLPEFEPRLEAALSFPYITESVYLRYSNLLAWVDLQEQIIPMIIGVMVVVAAFNLIGTILMMVLERVRDIGILKTMGATNRQIRGIFLLDGLLVGTLGIGIGVGTALVFSWAQATFGLIPLDPASYYMETAPVAPQTADYIWVSGLALGLSVLAAWLPARAAARIRPLETIQFGR